MDFLTVQDVKLILELTLPRKHYREKDIIKFINDRYHYRKGSAAALRCGCRLVLFRHAGHLSLLLNTSKK
jgi:hypothetical protein